MAESLAERARRAARSHPFLFDALAAGVVNYTAAARFVDVDGDEEAVATALRRFGATLEYATDERTARVRMHSGIGPVEDPGDALVTVGDTGFGPAGAPAEYTAVLATGDVDAGALATVLRRLAVESVSVRAAGVAGDSLLVVVGRRSGADAVRIVEKALDAVPV